MTDRAGRAVTPARRWLADGIAGVSVALVLIPQSMAYAELAGLPPHRGLYAGALPPLAAAFFASSPYLQTGPVALTSLLTFAALSSMATPGTDAYVVLAALLALVVGAVRVGLGLLRAGAVSYLMSQPVLRGFSAGAAVLICASQLPSVLGADLAAGGVLDTAARALARPEGWYLPALLLGGVTLALVLAGRRVHALFPGVLVAVLVGIAWVELGGYDGAVVGDVPAGLPPLALDLPWASLPRLALSGAVIALVGFAEAAAVSQTFAEQTRRPWDPDREFVSQGVANLASGLAGGFPVGGSFSRSSLNRLAGAHTRWAGAVTGLAVLAFLPVAYVLSPLPKAILGAAVIAAVLKLLDPRPLLAMWRQSRVQAGVGWATFAATLLLAPHIEHAVLAGVALSVGVHLWREERVEVLSDVRGGELHLRPLGVLWFGSAPLVRRALARALADHADVDRVVIDLSGVGRIDLTGASMLSDVAATAKEAGLSVCFTRVPPQAHRIVGRVCSRVAPVEPESASRAA